MTMHLERGLSMTNTKKRNVKMTKEKLSKLENEWRAYNKSMRRSGMHDFQFKTLEGYIGYTQGKTKSPKEFKEYAPKQSYRRTTQSSVSNNKPEIRSDKNATAKREPMKYTGTLVKGISTMHKSNLIPVVDSDHIKDVSKMRR